MMAVDRPGRRFRSIRTVSASAENVVPGMSDSDCDRTEYGSNAFAGLAKEVMAKGCGKDQKDQTG